MNTPIHHAPMMTNVCITAHSTPEPFSYGFHFVKQVHLQTLRMIPTFLHCLTTPYQPHMQNSKHFLWVMHFLHYHLKINLFLRLTQNKCFFTGPLRIGAVHAVDAWSHCPRWKQPGPSCMRDIYGKFGRLRLSRRSCDVIT